MAKLKIDLDTLTATINAYNTEITNIEDAKRSASRALQILRLSGWDSDAGKVWFSLLDEEWLRNIDYQIRVLRRLRDNLLIAKRDYQIVEEEQNKLGDVLL